MEFIQRNKWLLGIVLVAFAAFLIFQMTKSEDPKKQLSPAQEETEEALSFTEGGKKNPSEFAETGPKRTNANISSSDAEVLVVDVKGAVLSPGVYEMKKGSRVNDAVAIAGGLAEKADKKAINLALPLQDGTVVYIPIQGETIASSLSPNTQIATGGGGSLSQEKAKKVNLNQASTEELQSLTGIGPAKAEAIMAYREEKGGFRKIEELTNVTGIGDKSFEKLKDEVTVN